jgi:hypothetical protein
LRVTAAGLLAPYQHARMTSRRIRKPIDLSAPDSVAQAIANIAKIASLAAAGEIALDEANDLIGHQKAFIESKVGTDLETQVGILQETLRRLGDNAVPFGITVLDGLPTLPGKSIVMPQLSRSTGADANGNGNGHDPDRGSEGPKP